MKSIVCIFLVFLTFLPLTAQEKNDETLISGEVESGWSVGSYVGLSVFEGQTSITDGFRADWIINGTWFVGWHNYQSIGSNLEAPISTDVDKITMDIEYRGVLIGRMFNSKKLFHWGIEGFIGWGDIDYHHENGNKEWDEDYFYTAQPSLLAEVNVLHRFRIMGSFGYRFVQGVDLEGLNNSDINGLLGGITFRFGRF